MSALGQKRTCAVQKGMSALPLIATVKADIALQDACSSRRHLSTAAPEICAPSSFCFGHTKIESTVISRH